MTNEKLLLSTRKIESRYGLRKNFMEKLRLDGSGPRFVKLGRAVRYRQADIEAWLNQNSFGSTSAYNA